ncbi:uncharacterized protein LOC131836037 isoform X1 [Mustela lutreola]|uniref:uncharacterized protein LOC131836037 isoform X1 n=1 Tax=Mustela lutreola TaxID=9666 RepID=UPI00279700A4|nr:uncharacterized protein LOC131836037 isoform X1 [Mustela lutreola]
MERALLFLCLPNKFVNKFRRNGRCKWCLCRLPKHHRPPSSCSSAPALTLSLPAPSTTPPASGPKFGPIQLHPTGHRTREASQWETNCNRKEEMSFSGIFGPIRSNDSAPTVGA